jgi:hypothetical protein
MDMDVQIGKVIHFYDKIGVAVIAVTKPLKTGVTVKISGHDKEFTQEVASLQVEHKAVTQLARNKEGAMKVEQPVKEGDIVYLVKTK